MAQGHLPVSGGLERGSVEGTGDSVEDGANAFTNLNTRMRAFG